MPRKRTRLEDLDLALQELREAIATWQAAPKPTHPTHEEYATCEGVARDARYLAIILNNRAAVELGRPAQPKEAATPRRSKRAIGLRVAEETMPVRANCPEPRGSK
jgi:hypothetical protein